MIAKIFAGFAMIALFGLALFSLGKTIYHMWYVITGIRHEKRFLASFLGPLCLFMPTFFEEKAWSHRERLNFWLPVTMLEYGLLFGLKILLAQS